jgi:putative FmdB family regulatory protein
MPLYEYKCNSCAHRFERIVKFSDAPLKTCPQCGEDAIDQLISAPAVQFKGSGWYVTDYARKNSTPASSGKSDGSSETVSASKDNGNGNGSSGESAGSASSKETSDNGAASKSEASSVKSSTTTAVADSK